MIRIWDSVNNQELEPITIFFNSDGEVVKITAVKPNQIPIEDGWYNIEGNDIQKIAIIGEIKHNDFLFPDFYCQRDIEDRTYCSSQRKHCKIYYVDIKNGSH